MVIANHERILVLRILIIEENIKLRKRIKRILISKIPVLDIAEASDETETFFEIARKQPDLVVMDIRLTGENGLAIINKIKKRYPAIPIAVNTNNDSPEYESAAIDAGANYFYSKNTNTINDLVSLARSIFLKDFEGSVSACQRG